MPSLIDLLGDSMVFVGARGAESTLEVTKKLTFGKPPVPKHDVGDLLAQLVPIWHWTSSSDGEASDLTTIENLSCLTRGMQNMRMLVCRKISFGEGDSPRRFISVKLPGASAPLKLQLTKDYLVGKFLLSGGRIKGGTSKLFPLEAVLDHSMLMVFAYEFSIGSNVPKRPQETTMKREDFMPSVKARSVSGKSGQRFTATVNGLRVVVFVSLVCCRERDDFDPYGVLCAARFYPHMMIMANVELEQVIAKVGYTRPKISTMVGDDGSEKPMRMPDMNPEIVSELFTDRNEASKVPTWDRIFDYYDLNPKLESFVVVDPAAQARPIDGAVQELSEREEGSIHRKYVPRTVRKESRQAAFDSLHVAVTMRVPDSIQHDRYKGQPHSLDKIFMAPFCVHDCVHTHWRWGKGHTDKPNLGWSGDTPYTEPGAPMVPCNQTVRVHIVSPRAFEYMAQADSSHGAIAAGTWTIINHHGSAYAISVGSVGFKTGVARRIVYWHVGRGNEPIIDDTGFAVLYWYMRFGGTSSSWSGSSKDIVQERLNITSLIRARDG